MDADRSDQIENAVLIMKEKEAYLLEQSLEYSRWAQEHRLG